MILSLLLSCSSSRFMTSLAAGFACGRGTVFAGRFRRFWQFWIANACQEDYAIDARFWILHFQYRGKECRKENYLPWRKKQNPVFQN